MATNTVPSQWHYEDEADLLMVVQILTEQSKAMQKANRRKG